MKCLLKPILLAIALVAAFAFSACAANNPVYIPGWDKSYWQSPPDMSGLDPEKTGIRIVTDQDKVAEGLASIEIFVEKNYDLLNAQAAQLISGLELGKDYRLTGKFWVPGDSWRFRLRFGDSDLVSKLTDITGGIVGQWADVDYTFTFNYSSKEFRIQAAGGGSIFADSLSIREVLYAEDGKTVVGYGDELLVNGDFEDDLDLTPPGEVMDVHVENMDEQVKITWKNPYDLDFQKAVIYDITTGEKSLVGTATDGQILIGGLENGRTYIFLIQTVDGWNNHSPGVEVVAEPIPLPFKSKEPVFYINEVETNSISAGTLKAVAEFKNNDMPQDYSVELILALFKDGALVDINSAYYIIPRTGLSEAYTQTCVELNVPGGEGYFATLYIWDSITGMETLIDNITIK